MPTTAPAVALAPATDPRPTTRTRKSRRPAVRRLQPACQFDDLKPLADTLRSRVIGQDDSLDILIGSFSRLLSGLRDPYRPLLSALLLGGPYPPPGWSRIRPRVGTAWPRETSLETTLKPRGQW